MNFYRLSVTSLAALALAACGGSGGDPIDEIDFVLSSGALQNIEVPTAEILDGLPTDVANVVANFQSINESTVAATDLPTSTATFTGEMAVGAEGEDSGTVVGDLTLVVEFGGDLITGTFVPSTAFDADNAPLSVDRNLTVNGAFSGTSMQASLQGTLDVNGDSFGIDGAMGGGFYGAGAAGALGTVSGTVTNPDETSDNLVGFYEVEKQNPS